MGYARGDGGFRLVLCGRVRRGEIGVVLYIVEMLSYCIQLVKVHHGDAIVRVEVDLLYGAEDDCNVGALWLVLEDSLALLDSVYFVWSYLVYVGVAEGAAPLW